MTVPRLTKQIILSLAMALLVYHTIIPQAEVYGSPYNIDWMDLSTVPVQVELTLNGSTQPLVLTTNKALACGDIIVYAVNYYILPYDHYGNLSFSTLVFIKIKNDTASLMKTVRLQSIVINDIALDKENNTIYLGGINTNENSRIIYDSVDIGEDNNSVFYIYTYLEGMSSHIIKIGCNGTVLDDYVIRNFTVKSIDFNNKYKILALLGYEYTGDNNSYNKKNWHILLIDSNTSHITYESPKITLYPYQITPMGISWSPSGNYLSTGIIYDQSPLIYKYDPVSKTLDKITVANMSSGVYEIVTNTWLVVNNQSDVLMIGSGTDIYIIDIANNPNTPLAVIHTNNTKLCCGAQAIRGLPLISFIQTRNTMSRDEEGIIIVYLHTDSKNSMIQRLSYYPTYAPSFFNGEILPILIDHNQSKLLYTRMSILSYSTRIQVNFKLIKVDISKNSIIQISTIKGTRIVIREWNAGTILYNINTTSSIVKIYLPHGQYSVTVILPKPQNYIGSLGLLTLYKLVNISSSTPIELNTGYNDLLGRLIIQQVGNVTVNLYDLENGRIYRLEAGRSYYIAPGEYSLKIKSTSPYVLANQNYNLKIQPGETLTITIPLSSINIIKPQDTIMRITGSGGTTKIPASITTATIYAIPGEYTITLAQDGIIIYKTSITLSPNNTYMLNLTAFLQSKTPPTTTSQKDFQESIGRAVAVLISLIILILLAGSRYLLRRKQDNSHIH